LRWATQAENMKNLPNTAVRSQYLEEDEKQVRPRPIHRLESSSSTSSTSQEVIQTPYRQIYN
jgi:hypothetical protein